MLTAVALIAAFALPPPLPPASDFVAHVDNPWFPLTPGTVLTYRGDDEGTPATDVFHVTHETKTIAGIRATVVHDRVYEHGRVTERTTDWYAQDDGGNVWYLGEDTATYKPDGSLESRAGTWRAGVGGGHAGIFMPARPRVGDRGWQEYDRGNAQDRYRILRVGRETMLVQETTPLEPGVVDHKTYRRGTGTITEQTIRGGREQYRLVSVRRP